jgi:hypothetical protein
MPRPCRTDTLWFRRQLTDQQRAILLAAGDGDITIGFNECLELWRAINPLKGHFMPNNSSGAAQSSQQVKYPGKAPSDSPAPHAKSA